MKILQLTVQKFEKHVVLIKPKGKTTGTIHYTMIFENRILAASD